MLSANGPRCNFDTNQPGIGYNMRNPVSTDPSDPSLLALRVQDRDHALEPGRDYVLGSAVDCDLRVDARNVAPHHIRIRGDGQTAPRLLDLGSPLGALRNGERVDEAMLEIGDVIRFGGASVTLVRDDGGAQVVPLPAQRTEAALRRIHDAQSARHARRFEELSFHDLMAVELRRAPWMLVSALTHALLLLLLFVLFPDEPIGGDTRATAGVDLGAAPPVTGLENPEIPEVVPETDPTLDLPVDPEETKAPVEVILPEPEPRARRQLLTNVRITRRPDSPTSATRGVGSQTDLSLLGSKGFQKTVAQLKKSGLEIVFVFDSTGSMGMTIRQTKATIVEMLDMLRALVPDARFGFVTYRDRGSNEDYVVHELPLGLDIWHAANFVESITADGGGDRPEAVLEGLSAAFEQPWNRGSKRVVILAGDAPPHPRSWRNLERQVLAFSKRPNSHVHALVTSPRDAGRDTHAQFRRIAELGNGECLSLDHHAQVLQRVLDLAFGRQYDGDLAAVREAVTEARTHTETWALDLARRGGDELAVALRQRPVDPSLLHALIRLPKRRVAFQLVDLLGARNTTGPMRQAVAWVLQRTLNLSMPPIDPVDGKRPDRKRLQELRLAADRLPG